MTFDWKDRRVLVTGATGIVGSWLYEELLARGASVTALVLDEDESTVAADVEARCTVVRGNLADFQACMNAIKANDSSVIFHLGAQTIVGSALSDPLECFESNIRGTYNLLEAARQLPGIVERIVVASSDKAYGESPILPYTEEMPLRGTHPYDVSKSCTDLLANTYAHTYGMPVSVARCGNIYGGRDLNWSRIVPGTIRSILANERPVLRSDGTMVRDYIYVRDIVSAYITLAEAMDRPGVRGEAFNFSSESNHTVDDIVQAIRSEMHSKLEPVVLGTAANEILNQTLDASKAQARLGWNATWQLHDGLRETIVWYRRYLGE